jgi:hypothetical protein
MFLCYHHGVSPRAIDKTADKTDSNLAENLTSIMVTYRLFKKNFFQPENTIAQVAENYLLETIDQTIKPCDNFYGFVCNNIPDEDYESYKHVTARKWDLLYENLSKNASEFPVKKHFFVL